MQDAQQALGYALYSLRLELAFFEADSLFAIVKVNGKAARLDGICF